MATVYSYMHSSGHTMRADTHGVLLSKSGNGRHICVRVATPPHVARERKHCKRMASLYERGKHHN